MAKTKTDAKGKRVNKKKIGSRSRGWNSSIRKIFKEASTEIMAEKTHENGDAVAKDFIPTSNFINGLNSLICQIEEEIAVNANELREHAGNSRIKSRFIELATRHVLKNPQLVDHALKDSKKVVSEYLELPHNIKKKSGVTKKK